MEDLHLILCGSEIYDILVTNFCPDIPKVSKIKIDVPSYGVVTFVETLNLQPREVLTNDPTLFELIDLLGPEK